MSGKIPRAFIDDLLVRVDIVDLIDSHVPLKKTGSNYVARCPFHNEKSPSFSVNRAKQLYHCFGCGVGGNAISFIMDYNHLNFIEAVEDLAAFAGVSVPREALPEQQVAEAVNVAPIYAVLQQVAEYYVEQLRVAEQGRLAVTYLKERGIDSKVAADFMLGYAPEQWQALEQRFPRQALLDAGLLVLKEDDGRCYDRFRQRIVFPIRDKRGRVIALGARVLDNSLPKYLNSPETPVFQKGREVYGLYELLAKNARPKRILLVEGYMDVIALAQAGISYAVAALGTAVSKAHLDLLFRFTAEIVLCFDGDEAGRKAAWRAMDVVFPCIKEGRQVRIMLLPQGQDPDALVRTEGVEAFSARLEQAQMLSEYFFQQLAPEGDLQDIERRAQVVELAKPYVQKLPDGVFRQMMQARLAEITGVGAVVAAGAELRPQQSVSQNASGRLGARITPARRAIALLLQHPELVDRIDELAIDWDLMRFPGVELLRKLIQMIIEVNAVNTSMLIEAFRDAPEYTQLLKLASMDLLVPEGGEVHEFVGALTRLMEQSIDGLLSRLLQLGGREYLDLFAKLSKQKEFKYLSPAERSLLQSVAI